MRTNMTLQNDLLEMYRAFLMHDHDTPNMDKLDIDKLYDTLENFEKYVDKFLRDFIKFSIEHRGKTEEDLLDELLDTLSSKLKKISD